jgi:hypothetical protein
MTTTSFQSRQDGFSETFRCGHDAGAAATAETAAALPASLPASSCCAQTRRMKAFAGQRQFQAPVADDFARGMLAPGLADGTVASPLKHLASALATLIMGLAAWRRHKPG